MLGSNVLSLLNDRINSGVEFASNERNRNIKIDWFLSGGIKNPSESTVSEAYKMSEIISKSDIFTYGNIKEDWSFIYDTIATNTAENFIMAKNHIEENSNKYSEIYVVTSDFHYDRASKISEKIMKNNGFKWILSDLELHDSRYWETIHVKNVDNDANKALYKFSI